MGYHLRIEHRDKASFITARTKNSEMWFANNVKVEQLALARLAQYTDKYCVHIYAFALEGSHYHHAARFPLLNRSDFARDFNSTLARGVDRLTPNYPGGRLWGRNTEGVSFAPF
jgi:hypothetical protein